VPAAFAAEPSVMRRVGDPGGCPVHTALEVVTVMLTAVTMSLALAHALELPGKLRLTKDQYLAVQTIYYPGFTIGGVAELASIIATLALLVLTPPGTSQFRLIAGALAALVAVQAIFWMQTQPVNKYWLQSTKLSSAASRFFEAGSALSATDWADWTEMRNRWERSHVQRAVASTIALLLLTTAIAH
jgi:hypothetical protein